MEKTIVIEKSGKWDTDFDRIIWGISARSGGQLRHNINCILIASGTVTSTDGHRLHMATLDREIPDGVYSVKSVTRKMVVLEKSDLEYPDYERIFRGLRPAEHKKSLGCSGDPSRFIFEVYNTGNCFNIKYLEGAYMENSLVNMEIRNGLHPATFYTENHDRLALVMPLKID